MAKQPDPKSAIKKKAADLRKTLAQLDKLTGEAFTVSRRADVAAFFAVSVQSVDKWLAAGMPGSRAGYDLHKIVCWLRSEGPWRPLGGGRGTAEDLVESGPESEWSEEYRKWKARIAELDYQERIGELVSVDKANHLWHDVVMPEVRAFAERVILAHGNGTAADWTETVERIDAAITREFEHDDNDNQQDRSKILDGDEAAPTAKPSATAQ